MPAVASAIAMPLSKTERISIISNGGGEGAGAGASKITRDVTNIISQIPEVIESLTGIVSSCLYVPCQAWWAVTPRAAMDPAVHRRGKLKPRHLRAFT